MLNILIGKSAIIADVPLAGPPIAAALRALEGVVDVSLTPTTMPVSVCSHFTVARQWHHRSHPDSGLLRGQPDRLAVPDALQRHRCLRLNVKDDDETYYNVSGDYTYRWILMSKEFLVRMRGNRMDEVLGLSLHVFIFPSFSSLPTSRSTAPNSSTLDLAIGPVKRWIDSVDSTSTNGS